MAAFVFSVNIRDSFIFLNNLLIALVQVFCIIMNYRKHSGINVFNVKETILMKINVLFIVHISFGKYTFIWITFFEHTLYFEED